MRYLLAVAERRSAFEFVPYSGPPRSFTFRELNQWVERYACLLHLSGIRKGDRVCLFLPNSPQLIVSLFGNHLIGAISVPVNPAHSMEELAYIAERAEISALVSDHDCPFPLGLHLKPSQFWPALPERGDFPESQDEDCPALLCFTSGTTARPKGVLLTHRNVRSNLQDLIQAWGWTKKDRLLLSLPLFHIHGLGVGLHGWALTGCQAVITERFQPAQVLDLLVSRRSSLFMAVPTMYRRLLASFDPSRHHFRSLRLAITGSAPMPIDLHRRCQEVFGQTILERYGMTETIMNTSNPLAGKRKPGSVGLPLPSVQIRLLDERSQEIREPNRPGEIYIRGVNVFSGYWKDPVATRKSFHEGWLRTGDVAYQDQDGYYYLLGRVSLDLIKSGGYRIGAREIEEVLERHPSVREAAVVGLPDEDLGERITAFVVPENHVEEPALLEYCHSLLATYKCPRSIVFLAELPKNSMGKVSKRLLKSQEPSCTLERRLSHDKP